MKSETEKAYSNATAYLVDVMEIRNINIIMTQTAVKAIDEICTSLKFLSLQTGTNVSNSPFATLLCSSCATT